MWRLRRRRKDERAGEARQKHWYDLCYGVDTIYQKFGKVYVEIVTEEERGERGKIEKATI